MAEYIDREADSLKYYVVRNKTTGEYFRGKGVNKWGKYYNQASIYRIKKHAENAVEEESMRGTDAEVVEIRILETSDDVVYARHGKWRRTKEPLGFNEVDCVECSSCGESWITNEEFDFEETSELWRYCPNCGAKMRGNGE